MSCFFLCLLPFHSYGQDRMKVTGSVVNDKGEPISFVNIAIYSLPDSILVEGGVSGNEGRFELEVNKVLLDSACVRFSFIGYQSYVERLVNLDMGTISLTEKSNELSDIVIKGNMNIYKVENGVLKATIKNSVLSQLGTANAVISHLPFIVGDDGKFSVMGRGTPDIYINNRKVRDENELRQLRSNQIEKIEIILNPGVEYESSTGAVLKITTLPNQGDGMGGWLYTMVNQKRLFTHDEAVSLNYRVKGLDIFGYANYEKSQVKINQSTFTKCCFSGDEMLIWQDGVTKSSNESCNLQGGFNYNMNDIHTFGVKYNYVKYLKAPDFYRDFKMETLMGGVSSSNNDINSKGESIGNSHYLNVYYQWALTKKSILHFDGDYMSRDNDQENVTLFKKIKEIRDHSSSNKKLYAGNIWFKSLLWNGDLLFGVESSYTDNRQLFSMSENVQNSEISNTIDESNQANIATYCSYRRTWRKMSFDVGLRYEYVLFNYYLNKKKQSEQSKVYQNVFPLLSMNYNGDDLSASLSYRNQIKRPQYHQLRSSISYIDPYTYESGNPSLQPSVLHISSFMLSWKKLNLNLNYVDIENVALLTMLPFENKSANLSTFVNVNAQLYSLYLSYSRPIAFWNPTLSIGGQMQNLNYEGRSYNSPIFNLAFRNLLSFRDAWLIGVSLQAKTKGHDGLHCNKANFTMDLSVQKKINDGQWEILVGARDLWNTNRERWSMQAGSIALDKWSDMDSRSIYASIVFYFNNSASKYRGKSAAKDEMNRL